MAPTGKQPLTLALLSFQMQQPNVLSSPSLMPWCRNRKKHLVVMCLRCVDKGGVLPSLAPFTTAPQERHVPILKDDFPFWAMVSSAFYILSLPNAEAPGSWVFVI